MTQSNHLRPLTAEEIDSVTGGRTIGIITPTFYTVFRVPGSGSQITAISPGSFSTINASSGNISQFASTGTGSGFSSIST